MEGLLLCTSGLVLLIGLVALIEGSTRIVEHSLHRRRVQKGTQASCVFKRHVLEETEDVPPRNRY
jgi:hypothetical protein